MKTMTQIQLDTKKIAADVVSVGVAVLAVLGIIVAIAPSVHIPTSVTAVLVTASSVLATVIAEARRVAEAKKVAAKRAAGK